MPDIEERTESKSALRNRKTTVEDAEEDSDSPVASTSATSISGSKKSTSASQKDLEDAEKKKRTLALNQRIRQQQNSKKSRFQSILFSLFVATLGVLLKSAYDKLLSQTRTITITQTAGIQGNCYKTAYIPGPSDIEIDDRDQIAFVSSDDRSWIKESNFFHRPSKVTSDNGGIYTLSLSQKTGSPREVKLVGYPSDDFHPAGMSYYNTLDPKTQTLISKLFVINHSHKGDFVEIFDFSAQDNTLTFVKSIQSSLFTTPKDVVAIDNERFYLTNRHFSTSKYGRVAEEVTGLAWGSVVYCNGDDCRNVLENLNNPTGIAVSPDTTQLFISSFMDKSVQVYNVTEDITKGELIYDTRIWIGSYIDNLSVDKHTGDIYVASHPSYSRYLRHTLGYEPQAPSHVVKIEKLSPENYIYVESSQPDLYFFETPKVPPLKWEVKDFFYSNGEDISASSVAAYWNNDLILGSYSSHHLLRCSLRLEQ
ncbi:hypothetical protein BGZ76_003703 [Entomortierella beljakovae]|nr:hypothetical protein BGZ76_003703 [Entomortierella beljakovae]